MKRKAGKKGKKEASREAGSGTEELEMISQRLETRNRAIKKIMKQLLKPGQDNGNNPAS